MYCIEVGKRFFYNVFVSMSDPSILHVQICRADFPLSEDLFALSRPMSSALQPLEFNQMRNIDVDVVDNPKEFLLTASVPGVEKKDLKLNVDESGNLVISGERNWSNEKKTPQFSRQESFYGTVSRSMKLPKHVDASKISSKVYICTTPFDL